MPMFLQQIFVSWLTCGQLYHYHSTNILCKLHVLMFLRNRNSVFNLPLSIHFPLIIYAEKTHRKITCVNSKKINKQLKFYTMAKKTCRKSVRTLFSTLQQDGLRFCSPGGKVCHKFREGYSSVSSCPSTALSPWRFVGLGKNTLSIDAGIPVSEIYQKWHM